ncbi:MAG: DUF6159 family protein [Desulfosudis oleivorans]|nr:DUF6159 family protein [Desulfosudis oleivorans]
MVFPTIITAILKEQQISNLLFYGILFLTYLGLAIIATFFNVCVVYTAKTRFEGKNATSGDAVRFAFSGFGIILAWSLLAATVGLILRVIDNAAERMGGIGALLLKITTSLLGAAWSLVIFVVEHGLQEHRPGRCRSRTRVRDAQEDMGRDAHRRRRVRAREARVARRRHCHLLRAARHTGRRWRRRHHCCLRACRDLLHRRRRVLQPRERDLLDGALPVRADGKRTAGLRQSSMRDAFAPKK